MGLTLRDIHTPVKIKCGEDNMQLLLCQNKGPVFYCLPLERPFQY